ncbi:MAG: NADH-quinone oxidoreductase subunit C [Elusimicrobiota bacterium]
MKIIDEIKNKFGSKIKKFEEKNPRRFYIDILPSDAVFAAKILFVELQLRFVIATGIDRPDGLEILYHFSDDKSGCVISVRVLIADKERPEIDTISKIIKGAEWIEREMWELLGINFRGHPNLKHLLLRDDWPEKNYPLRQGQGEGRKND